MKHDLTRLPKLLDKAHRTCRAVIETPKGRRSKYDYDRKTGVFSLKKLLPEGQSFPLDFGFIPSTHCDDGDPMDVMILMDEPGIVGGVVEIRVLGVLEIEEIENGIVERNDRIVGVATESYLYENIRKLSDIESTFIKNLESFWENKAQLEHKQLRVLGVRKAKRALALIRKASRKPSARP